MSDNINPDQFLPLGPMFARWPLELVLEVFKWVVLVDQTSIPGKAINKDHFNVLNVFDLPNLCAVNKTFRFLVLQAFYMHNNFSFKCTGHYRRSTPWHTSKAPTLPLAMFRPSLRRIHVELILEDFYVGLTPTVQKHLSAQQLPNTNAITSVHALLTHCAGARLLQSLTNASTGFNGLSHLDLHIYVHVRYDQDRALSLFQQAGFAVHAVSVKVTVTDRKGVAEPWHAAIDQAIRRI